MAGQVVKKPARIAFSQVDLTGLNSAACRNSTACFVVCVSMALFAVVTFALFAVCKYHSTVVGVVVLLCTWFAVWTYWFTVDVVGVSSMFTVHRPCVFRCPCNIFVPSLLTVTPVASKVAVHP